LVSARSSSCAQYSPTHSPGLGGRDDRLHGAHVFEVSIGGSMNLSGARGTLQLDPPPSFELVFGYIDAF
jgi:hypothetical protein